MTVVSSMDASTQALHGQPLSPADTAAAAAGDEVQPLVTRREWWGWYLYNAAANAFSLTAMSIFVPLLLLYLTTAQALIQQGTFRPPDCNATITEDCLKCVPGRGQQLITPDGYSSYDSPDVQLGALRLDPVSYTTVIIGVAVAVQVVGLVTCGPLADFGAGRHKLLLFGTLLGATPCLLSLALLSPSLWWLAGVLVVMANLGYGVAAVAYNSYLPVLVDASPAVVAAGPDEESILEAREKTENQSSLAGLACGCLGSVVSMLLAFALSILIKSDSLKLRVITAVCGAWWLLLSSFTFAWLRQRPGPPRPAEGLSLIARWRHMIRLFAEARRYRNAFIMLLCFVGYGSGFTTMLQMAVLFGQRDLCLSISTMAIISLTVAVVAILGMPLALMLQRRTRANNKTMAVVLLACILPLPVWGFIGYFTGDNGFGLKSTWEIFTSSAWLGLFLGALTSYSRTLFIGFIPVGREGAFFSLFFICDRLSSCIGPFVVAVVVQVGGQLRPVFCYVFFVLLIPAIVMQLCINHKQGVADAGRTVKAHQ